MIIIERAYLGEEGSWCVQGKKGVLSVASQIKLQEDRNMRIVLVDPSGFTPPYDHCLATALA